VPIELVYQPEVKLALDEGRPVVALESTLITHGFPSPANVEIAREIEDTVRQAGAIPATVAVLAGQIVVGLSSDQLTYLGTGQNVRKCSRRDLPIVVARREDGATTVAGTMIVAKWAGIRVFGTGGIGGVHRDHPFDESADLAELGRTPVTVVCAGAKAILDLPLTAEVLETHGVAILGYQTDELPAFYSRHSGLPVDLRVDTPREVADLIRAREQLGLEGGTLVTVPVPVEEEWPADEAQEVINKALIDAKAKGISGKAVTPFLLERVNVLSGGRSKKANVALLLNNARVAAKIAVVLAEKES
jgi:pseudouridine-5'-phosphate glycosidase